MGDPKGGVEIGDTKKEGGQESGTWRKEGSQAGGRGDCPITSLTQWSED